MARLSEAARAVQALWDDTPRVGLVLGTGLCGLADAIECDAAVPYGDLPHFPLPTVPTRQRGLICGALEDVPVVAMQGRLHRYEGYTLAQVAFPVRLMRLLGTEALIVTAACGAVNPLWALGDIVVLDDHINLMGDSPLIGPNLDEIGPRFPDMSAPYDPALQELATRVALSQGTPLRRGVYAAVVGPQLETRAEYRMLRRMGADVVGMSTVPDVIAARHAGMRVLALAVVTDMCLPDALEEVDIEAIVATAQAAEPTLRSIVRGVLRESPWSE
ncbi:MAG: purine-nucleoside phosphorylase [Gemmatimonadetes bacterium]|nr:purine-nucleoside phosphorylase [Gemmatimonadota bacterium]